MRDQRSDSSRFRAAIRWLRSPSAIEPRPASAPAQPGSANLFIR